MKTPKLYLVDTTLRDGEQAPGVAFTVEQRLCIAQQLDALGVEEIEVGTPAMGEEDCRAIREMTQLGLQSRLIGWGRLHAYDLRCAASCGLEAMHLSLPASDRLLAALGKNRDWLLSQLSACVEQAKRMFAFVSVGFQDASRMPEAQWGELLRRCTELGVQRVRLSDTVGQWTPLEIGEVFTKAVPIAGDVELGFHGHNDLGMATANAWTALQSGATCADVTVNGLGERAGNAALEQLAVTRMLHDRVAKPNYVLERLPELCAYVARCAGMPIPPNQPVTGKRIFEHESGIHVRGMLDDTSTYELYRPEVLGRNDRRLILGRHSGRAGVQAAMQAMGIPCEGQELDALLMQVRQTATAQGGEVSRSQLLSLYQQMRASTLGVTA